MVSTGGRADTAPEINNLESAVFLCEGPHELKVLRFAPTVSYKAVPALGKGRKVGLRGGGEPKLTFRAVRAERDAGRLLVEPGPRRTEDSKPRVSGSAWKGVDAAGRLRKAAGRPQEADSDSVLTSLLTRPANLEHKVEKYKWQRIVTEAKELKRQWADLEDSDEEPPGAGGG